MSLHALLLGLVVATALTAPPHSASAAGAELHGFGDSLALPTGEPWVLPEGIELVAAIESYNYLDPDSCKHPDAPAMNRLGPEGLVHLCLQFRNTTHQPISVRLPPGLIFISESQKNQHGMVVQTETLEVPSNQYLFAPINLDCMNASRSAPGIGFPYRVGPVTDNADIQEALRLLDDKDLSDPFAAAEAGSVLKPLYLGKPFTADGRSRIADLPLR